MPDEPTPPDPRRSPDEPLGAWVRRARQGRGWSEGELAAMAQVPEAQLRRLEAGDVVRQRSSRERLRTVLESGEAYVPVETLLTGPPAAERARRWPRIEPLSPHERLAVHADLLGAGREGGDVAAQAAALIRWAEGRPQLRAVRVGSLLPGLGTAPGAPSRSVRTPAAREVLRRSTPDGWRWLAAVRVAELLEGLEDEDVVRDVLEGAAAAWARLPA